MVKKFLSSDRKIYDSIHGFIRFDDIEKELIDSLPFQRLRSIHQLGAAYLVYPGATHTRFEHSLGVMELSSWMFAKVCKSVRPDLFALVPRKGSFAYHYWQKIIRLAALCHDLGHLPFSHVGEKLLLGDKGHEYWTLKIIQSSYLQPVFEKLKTFPWFGGEVLDRDVVEDVAKLAIGDTKLFHLEKKTPFTAWERILSALVTGNFFGADRIDYLLRDSKATGISYGVFDYQQLIETLSILPLSDESVELGIEENGLEACEALLLARHFMHRRVYQYTSIKAYNFHLCRFMKSFFAQGFSSVEAFVSYSDMDVMIALQKAAKDPKMEGHIDAKKFLRREAHFKAIALDKCILEKDLLEFQKQEGVAPDQIGYEFSKPALETRDLTFPVARRHLNVERASECSFLLSKLPHVDNNWVFIAPEYDLVLLEFLKKKIEERR